jgi:hypothetical protein
MAQQSRAKVFMYTSTVLLYVHLKVAQEVEEHEQIAIIYMTCLDHCH